MSANSVTLSCCLVLALLLVAAAIEARGEAKTELSACRPLDECRGRVSNKACCKAIASSIITRDGCSCVCMILKKYGVPTLTSDCYKNSWCSKCDQCPCSNLLWMYR